VRQLCLGRVDPRLELLDAARRPDHPAVVAEVLAQLTADRRHGVGEEVVAGGHVVPARGLGERERGNLPQVVQGDPPRAVTRGLGVGEVEVHLDHRLEHARPLVGAVRGLGEGEQLARVCGTLLRCGLSPGRSGLGNRRHSHRPVSAPGRS
jgi:hypothetical protein